MHACVCVCVFLTSPHRQPQFSEHVPVRVCECVVCTERAVRVRVYTVGVHHEELPRPQQTVLRTELVTILVTNLIKQIKTSLKRDMTERAGKRYILFISLIR